MLDFLIQGFLIGLLVSIPVGPIAVLCIQRTLNKGKWHGFATGLGAAFSDMIYALITGFGMSFVITFITSNQYIIQIIGSVVICLFGIYIYRSNPLKQLTPAHSPSNYIQDFATAFFMTISNPMIIFLFIGFYARFNFIHEGISFAKTILGVLFVFLGASTWWFTLVSIVNFFKTKFNLRSLGLINKITGGVIIVIAIGALVLTLIGKRL